MGGFGSGRRGNGAARTTDSVLKIDLHLIRRSMRKAGSAVCVVTWDHGRESITGLALMLADRLVVQVGGALYEAPIQHRPARFGGVVASLLCGSCARSCTTVFIADNCMQCRQCAKLTYASKKLNDRDRKFSRLSKLLAELDGDVGRIAPSRPKGMWRRTYQRLLRRVHQTQHNYYLAVRNGGSAD